MAKSNNMSINELNKKLKDRLVEYRMLRRNTEISVDINAIDIATSLVDYAIKTNRAIRQEEKCWFNASYQLSYVLDGSEWQDLSDMYSQLCDELEIRNFDI